MRTTVIPVLALLCLAGCGTQAKIGQMEKRHMGASLELPDGSILPRGVNISNPKHDTLTVTGPEGERLLIMKAIKDENGEMVANDFLDAAVVTARFRNIAERMGKVDLRFQVRVPAEMQDSRWQLKLTPVMKIQEDTVSLDPVIITGKAFRKAQLRGYQQYERFLGTIVTDSSQFINIRELEIFLHRNLPQIYNLKEDSTFVSDEEFASIYGITQRQAVEHYTSQARIRSNDKRVRAKDKMFARYVKSPFITEGLKLDTVITADGREFIYEYVQTVVTRPSLRSIELSMSGAISEEGKQIYSIPESDPLTFYISSLSSFTDDRKRYKTVVVERSIKANSTYVIDFETGSSHIDPEISDNRSEIGRIQSELAELMGNDQLEMDSIRITASCSPEGSYDFNRKLSLMRSEAVGKYFNAFLKRYSDSLAKERAAIIRLDDSRLPEPEDHSSEIRFLFSSVPENWDQLVKETEADDKLSREDKSGIKFWMKESNPDIRESCLSSQPYYSYVKDNIYPRLRTVRFDFFLHRKGMIKDTVHTTILDSAYMEGVAALKERDYKRAVTLLRPYGDFNSALAFSSLDYNASARKILETLPQDANTRYLLAIILSRQGENEAAVQHYLDACNMDESFVHRGNLDPEISLLIRLYGLHDDK